MAHQYMFGTGRLTAMPVGGGAPTAFGALQDVSVDITGDVKELYGRNQFPLDVARGKVKVQAKAKFAQIDVSLYNTLFFGQAAPTVGQTLVADNESDTIASTTYASAVPTAATTTSSGGVVTATLTVPATTGLAVGQWVTVAGMTPAGYNGTYQVTALTGTTISYVVPATLGAGTVFGTVIGASYQLTVTNAANFSFDLGVVYTVGGGKLTNTPGVAPVQGTYTVTSNGIYEFSAADKGLGVLVTYAYNSATTGLTLPITNVLMGAIPTFQAVLNGFYKTQQVTLLLYACSSSKFNFPLKLDDYMMSEFDFGAFDNGSGQVMQWTATNL